LAARGGRQNVSEVRKAVAVAATVIVGGVLIWGIATFVVDSFNRMTGMKAATGGEAMEHAVFTDQGEIYVSWTTGKAYPRNAVLTCDGNVLLASTVDHVGSGDVGQDADHPACADGTLTEDDQQHFK
jgi:hypothetical protein